MKKNDPKQRHRRWPLLKKMLIIMKLTTMLIFLAFFQLSAKSYSQEKKLSLKFENESLENVFSKIEASSEFSIFYKNDLIKNSKEVTGEFKDALIFNILDQILKTENLTYTIKDKLIMIVPSDYATNENNAQQPGKKVSGKVTDQSGASLPGVSVVVKGTSTGIVTDNNGNFSLTNIPENATLQFSFVGMKTQEIKVGNQTSINVLLAEDAIGLEEVVAIGYGTQRKLSMTGSVSAIGGKLINDRPVTNISNALNGLAPGLSVISSTSVPGQSSNIKIRGLGTFNNTAPLYVIDGVIRDQTAMDALDPNSISNISILKDAASAAVYGSRAANGVILIITKQGNIQAPEITFKTTYGIESPTVETPMMTAYENGLFINDMVYNMMNYDLNAMKLDPRSVTDQELEYMKTHNYQWLDYVWKVPTTVQSNLSVNGGSEKIKYFMAVGYTNNQGGFDNLGYKKYNFQGNTTVNINKNLIATVNLSANVRESDLVSWRFSDGADLSDTYRCFKEWGGSWMPPYINGIPTHGGYANIIEAMRNGGYDRTKNTAMSGLLSLNYKIPFIQGLSLKGTYSYNFNQILNKRFVKPTTSYIFRGSGDHGYIYDSNSTVTGTMVYSPSASSYVREGYNGNIYQQFNLQADYAKIIGKHSINASLIFEQSSVANKNFTGQKNKLLTNTIDELFVGSAESAQTTFSGTSSTAARLSYIGRLSYSFNNKYLLDASFREDGSYIFAPGYQWGFFPSVSAGWRISEESFFRDNIKFVDNLKIRASLGLLGNDAVNPYQWESSYSTQNGPFFGAATSAIYYGVLPNKNITWEKSRVTNVGFDANFLSNTVDFSFDYFHRYTYDMLFSRTGTMPGTFGATLPNENYGKVQNNGIEVNLGYNGHANKINYYVRGNLGYAKDKVKYIDVAANVPAYLNPIGLRLSTIKGYVTDGLFRTQADFTSKLPLQGYIPALGMMAYKDLYGPSGAAPDGVVNANDQVVISQNANPLYNFGFTLGAKWNQFSIDILAQGLAGWDKVFGPTYGIINGNNYAIWKDRWSPANPNGSYPRAWYVDGSSNQRSTFWMKNASFLRLKNINISYAVPLNSIVAKKSGIKGCKIYVNGSNLFLLYDKVKVMDPELNSYGSYPIMRDITAGIEITF